MLAKIRIVPRIRIDHERLFRITDSSLINIWKHCTLRSDAFDRRNRRARYFEIGLTSMQDTNPNMKQTNWKHRQVHKIEKERKRSMYRRCLP